MTYKRLVFDLEESQSGIPATAMCSRLVTALPRDWSAFKQSWTTQPSDLKTFAALLEMIRSEIARREIDDSIDCFHFKGSNQQTTKPHPRTADNQLSKEPVFIQSDHHNNMLDLWSCRTSSCTVSSRDSTTIRKSTTRRKKYKKKYNRKLQ